MTSEMFSNAQPIADQGDDRVGHDDIDDAVDDRGRRGIADRRGAASALHASHAAGRADQYSKYQTFE